MTLSYKDIVKPQYNLFIPLFALPCNNFSRLGLFIPAEKRAFGLKTACPQKNAYIDMVSSWGQVDKTEKED